MAITFKTQPDIHSAAYSALPLRLLSSNVGSSENFKYTINIVYNNVTSVSMIPVSYDGFTYTKVTTTTHNFIKGDSIMIDGGISDPQYTNYYTVMEVVDSTNIIIDLTMGAPISGVLNLYTVIKYKFSPDQLDEVKMDLSNVLKDFVTKNLEDVNEIFDGKDTRFDYSLIIGEELTYVLNFEDNTDSGNVASGPPNGFLTLFNTSIVSMSGIPFEVGDSIIIEQDLYEWVYSDNYSAAGQKLGFTTSNPTNVHNFLPGQQVIISGQVTENYYNGTVGVNSNSLTNTVNLITDKSFTTATPVEGGSIFGVPRPDYNTVATITLIEIDPLLGLVIVTDVNHTGPTQPLPGTIRYSDSRLTTSYAEDSITSLRVYNAHINRLDYSKTFYDKYTIQSRPITENFLSTIYDYQGALGDNKYRIERSTKSWLLAHTRSGLTDRVRYLFYDNTGAIINITEMMNVSGNVEDFYFPIGIDQIIGSVNTTLIAGTALNLIADDVSEYVLSVYNSSSSQSEFYRFKINTDCSSYDLLHLMWKDRYGSWISFPFKYISTDSTEFERKTFYKKEGEFRSDNTFGYDTFDRGETSYFGRSRDKVNLNSGWIDDSENELIKDLLESTDVYLQNVNGDLIGCIIENKSFSFKNKNNDDIYQYTIGVRLSTNEIR